MDTNSEIASNARALSAWSEFDPEEYVQRNYGERIYPIDRELIAWVMEHLGNARRGLDGAKRVADVGSGPNLYPSMLLAAFADESAVVELVDPVLANRNYCQSMINASEDDDRLGIWRRFEELFVELGGDLYQGSLNAVRRHAQVSGGDIFSLPANTYDLVCSFFVADSITQSVADFHSAIRSLAASLKQGAPLVLAHAVDSPGYAAGESTWFPAVSLSPNDIATAYESAGLTYEMEVLTGIETQMAVAVARR